MRIEDATLVERARRGDADAFGILYGRYRNYVVAVASRFGATGADGHDVLQETFQYFLRKLPDYEPRAKLSTFLYPVAKHLALKKKAQGVRYVPLDPDHPAAGGRAAPEPEEAGRARLREAVSGLPEGQREVLMLRFADDLSLDEIARALSIPLGTVKSRLHNALSSLRSRLP